MYACKCMCVSMYVYIYMYRYDCVYGYMGVCAECTCMLMGHLRCGCQRTTCRSSFLEKSEIELRLPGLVAGSFTQQDSLWVPGITFT